MNPALREMVQDHLPDSHELKSQVYATEEELYGIRLMLVDTGGTFLHAWIAVATYCFESNHHTRC